MHRENIQHYMSANYTIHICTNPLKSDRNQPPCSLCSPHGRGAANEVNKPVSRVPCPISPPCLPFCIFHTHGLATRPFLRYASARQFTVAMLRPLRRNNLLSTLSIGVVIPPKEQAEKIKDCIEKVIKQKVADEGC